MSQKAINDLEKRPLKELMEALDTGRISDDIGYICDNHSLDEKNLPPLIKKALEQKSRAPVAQATSRHPARNTGPQGALDPDWLTAPYRFIALNKTIVAAEDTVKTLKRDLPMRDGWTGEIDLSLAFETPMLIGAGGSTGQNNKPIEPFKLGDRYAIPGSTVRGWLRSAMEIVCRARLVQINKNHRYGVRDFEHPLFADLTHDGGRRMDWQHVQAGWLQRVESTSANPDECDYVIVPCDKRIIRIRDLPARMNGGRPTNNGQWHLDWLRKDLKKRYDSAGMLLPNKQFCFDNTTARYFTKTTGTGPEPNYYVKDTAGQPGDKGWLVFSAQLGTLPRADPRNPAADLPLIQKLDDQNDQPVGKTGNYKKREYVFIEKPDAVPVRLKKTSFDRFELINSRPGKHKRKPTGSWEILSPTVENGRRIPIFYVGDLDKQGDDFMFGLTRLFKLAHEKSVGQMLLRDADHAPKQNDPDMVTALFGHVLEPKDYGLTDTKMPNPWDEHRKGRIAMSVFYLDAQTPATLTDPVQTVAMGPRASYAPFYLSGPIKDWTDDNGVKDSNRARLAGRKAYFPRFDQTTVKDAENQILQTLRSRKTDQNRDDQTTNLRFLKPSKPAGELVFHGRLRLHNVTQVEIGAVLWALTHGGDPQKPFRHMMGQGKTAGAGQMRVKSLTLRVVPHMDQSITKPTAWELPSATQEGWQPATATLSMTPFLAAFDKKMSTADPNWHKSADLQEFLGLAIPRTDPKHTAYLALKEHAELRKKVKARGNRTATLVTQPDRLLPAPSRPVGKRNYLP